MRRLISAALLAASFVAPATLAQTDTKSLSETVGPRFRGMISSGGKRTPFVVSDIKVLGGDTFEATLNWTGRGSIHKITGTFKNGVLVFKETAAIQQGAAPLGCEYKIDTTRVNGGQAQGQWGHCTGSSGYGDVTVFLPIVNEWTPNPNSATKSKSKGPDMDAAGQITAWADYAEANCAGLGVDHAKLEDFAKSAGTSTALARQSPAYKKATGELIPHDVSKYGVQQFCYLLQLQFVQPYTPIYHIIFKY